MKLWDSRLLELRKQKSTPWSLATLNNTLACLKNNKARDPHGIINELFKEGLIGIDLKVALLLMFNGMKEDQTIPPFLTYGNITSIHKNKGSRLNLNNERGIFILSVMKKMLFFEVVVEILQQKGGCTFRRFKY